MKMYVKPSFELEEVLSEDIITTSAFQGLVGEVGNTYDESGNPVADMDINKIL